MRTTARLTPLLALAAACAPARGRPADAATALPALPAVTRVVLTDAVSGTPLGAVQRPDSVAALATFYRRLAGGWAEGAAPSPEVAATFYRDGAPVAVLTLASGAFGTRAGGRVLRRPAGPDEALAFARLAGVPVQHGPRAGAAAPPTRP
jgi:hypothetical protein